MSSSSSRPHAPDLVPVLSRGKHRSPRKGACFMELAGYLAGERWSDHPPCTHPLLADLARSVNDLTSKARRFRLAPLIPSVIGLTGDDLHIDAAIALRCAYTALPVASAERQTVLAASILSTERLLAELDDRPAGTLGEASRRALESAPYAAAREAADSARSAGTRRGFRRHAAPATVRCATNGVAQACIDDPDSLLFDMLWGAIHDCTLAADRQLPTVVEPERWAAACALAGTAR